MTYFHSFSHVPNIHIEFKPKQIFTTVLLFFSVEVTWSCHTMAFDPTSLVLLIQQVFDNCRHQVMIITNRLIHIHIILLFTKFTQNLLGKQISLRVSPLFLHLTSTNRNGIEAVLKTTYALIQKEYPLIKIYFQIYCVPVLFRIFSLPLSITTLH